VCFDEWANANAEHGIQIFYNGDMIFEGRATCENQAGCPPVSFFNDGSWHTVQAVIAPDGGGGASVTFELDHGVYGGQGIIADYKLPERVYLGFTGRTGGATNNHFVKAIMLSTGRGQGSGSCHAGLYFEAYVPGGNLGMAANDGTQYLSNLEATVFDDVWNGWTPAISHEEHDHEIWYSNDQAFVDEIPGFGEMDNYVMRWRGQITVAERGDYTFQTSSDDGSMLYINNNIVVSNDGDHGRKDVVGTVKLAPGIHDIVISFYEHSGGALLEVSWSPTPGAALAPLGGSVLSNGVGCAGSTAATSCSATMYQHGGYQGWQAQFSDGDFNLAQFLAHGATDNDGSSLVVTGGDSCLVTVYENGDFTGWSRDFGVGSYDCCSSFPNDQPSSIQVHGSTAPMVKTDEAGSCSATMYQHDPGGGWAAEFSVGDYPLAQLLAHGGADNDGSSLVVVGAGCQVTVYENGDFTGWERTFGEGSFVCCDSFPNDQASSIRVHGSAGVASALFSNVVPLLVGGNCQGGSNPGGQPSGPSDGPRVCGAVSQSTMGWSGEPDRAIDGDRTTAWGGGSCSHTGGVNGPSWFQVDLGSFSTVDRVGVYHRTDCCQDRLESATIYISDTPTFHAGVICGTLNDHSQEPEVSQCGGAAEGQYVTVSLGEMGGRRLAENGGAQSLMTICEIEIYATAGSARPTGTNVDLVPGLVGGNCRGPSNPSDGPRVCGAASQSSMGWSGEPDRAIDGNIETSWGGGSCSHTAGIDGPSWFQIDLAAVALVQSVGVYHRTDCCQDRLESALIHISESPDYSTGVRCGGLTDHTQEPEISPCGGAAEGRYVTVSLQNSGGADGTQALITICEIVVTGFYFDSPAAFTNLVPGLQPTGDAAPPCVDDENGYRVCGAVSQASIGWGGEPNRAVDGNRDTNYGGNSCSHTDGGGAWFQVDLGGMNTIDRVAVYHRTDCCQDRLESALILVSTQPDFNSGVVCGTIGDHSQEPEVSQCGGAAEGRYVTVDLAGGGGGTSSGAYITICEIEIYAAPVDQIQAPGDEVDLIPLIANLPSQVYNSTCRTGVGSTSALYEFNGDAADSAGTKHGTIASATPSADRFNAPAAAFTFDGTHDFITLPTPFRAGNEDYTIAVWLSPAVVADGAWHGFVGFQGDGSRSPSHWQGTPQNETFSNNKKPPYSSTKG
jgi:hypothetical protein